MFLDYKIRIGEKKSFDYPVTKEKLSLDFKVRKPQKHFWKKKKIGHA